MELLFVNGLMELLSLENGKIVKRMGKEVYSFLMEAFIRGLLKMISQTEKELKSFQMEVLMKGDSTLECSMDMENLNSSVMAPSMWVNGSKTK